MLQAQLALAIIALECLQYSVVFAHPALRKSQSHTNLESGSRTVPTLTRSQSFGAKPLRIDEFDFPIMVTKPDDTDYQTKTKCQNRY